MKLYYSPQLCSIVPHILLRELGVPFDLERVDFKAKTTNAGVKLSSITPKDYVPVLELDDGERLTEVAVILHYLCDTHGNGKLAPARGTFERVRFDELVHFVSTELHKGFAPFSLMPNVGQEALDWARDRLTSRVAILRDQLGDRAFLFGDTFTAVDVYAWWALRSFSFLTKVKLDGTLKAYQTRMLEWPSIHAAVDVEKRAG